MENKAETSRKGGEGKQERMVLKLDGERGQRELIWCSPLRQNSLWSCYQTWPGEGRRTGVHMEKQGKRGGHCRPAPPQAAQRGFPWPQVGPALLPTGTISPPPHTPLEHHLQPGTHLLVPFCKKSMSCVYESAPCLTVSNRFLQAIPNCMPLVTANETLATD